MLLTTLRKPAGFVLQALSLLLGAVCVQAGATIVIAVIMLLVASATGSLGIVGVVASVAVVTAGIWAYPHAARVIAAKKERDEAEQRKTEGQASWEWTIRHFAADIGVDIDYALANDMVAIDVLRQMRNNDNCFSQLSKEERDRIDDLLLRVRQREDVKEAAERQSRAEADKKRAARLAANQEQAAWTEAERQKKAEEKRQAAAAKRAAKQQAEEAPQTDIWKGTGGPPSLGQIGSEKLGLTKQKTSRPGSQNIWNWCQLVLDGIYALRGRRFMPQAEGWTSWHGKIRASRKS